MIHAQECPLIVPLPVFKGDTEAGIVFLSFTVFHMGGGTMIKLLYVMLKVTACGYLRALILFQPSKCSHASLK